MKKSVHAEMSPMIRIIQRLYAFTLYFYVLQCISVDLKLVFECLRDTERKTETNTGYFFLTNKQRNEIKIHVNVRGKKSFL